MIEEICDVSFGDDWADVANHDDGPSDILVNVINSGPVLSHRLMMKLAL